MLLRRLTVGLCLLTLGFAGQAAADTISVAVAANFAEPAQQIAQAFKASTGHEARISPGASGQLLTQIAHGAPYAVFLSADAERPRRAETDGLGVAGTRFTYAVGRLALYSPRPGFASAGTLAEDRFGKLAIADPAVAPYGAAALETLAVMGLKDRLQGRVVLGSSIAQAHQFVASGAAGLGFVALSQVIGEPQTTYWIVPANRHKPIAQQAILLKAGADEPTARAFLTFLKGPQARAIIRRYGYAAPSR
ncbi:molybdate ABC transporter substrate-binding protein [Phenylobacterium immobile]|uniref:molybdate ABC transporter substrate-binding protein n=1 Tax=Phenylobacterium immobile TaxID=21 RepID=UPI000A46DB57|nr:molybdate ABC transporter substrate-binding protein [Phenylobacterium immobile]